MWYFQMAFGQFVVCLFCLCRLGSTFTPIGSRISYPVVRRSGNDNIMGGNYSSYIVASRKPNYFLDAPESLQLGNPIFNPKLCHNFIRYL